MAKIETDSVVAEYRDDTETKNAVFDKLISYFRKHEVFSGESICQMDNPQIDAPVVLSEIADDILKFDLQWKD